MKQLKWLIFLLLFLVSTSLGATGGVEGTVTDSTTGLPVTCNVQLFRGKHPKQATNTSQAGFYLISGVKAEKYTIKAYTYGFQTSAKTIKISNGITQVVNFSLVPNAGTIYGTVTDSNTQNPISGATVDVYVNGTDILAGSSTTDGSGNYSVGLLAGGPFTVVYSAPSYQTNYAGVFLAPPTLTWQQNVSLAPTPGTISGTVIDSTTTNPIEDVLVTAYVGTTVVNSAITDSSGNYTITGLAPGNYTVTATEIDYQQSSQGATVVASVTTTVNFSLQGNPGGIQGTITSITTGQPIPNLSVALYQGNVSIAGVRTDDNGVYEFTSLAPGDNYFVAAGPPNYETEFMRVTVSAGTITTAPTLQLTLASGVIEGVVTDATTSQPIMGAQISVISGQTVVTTALTNSLGQYHIITSVGNYTVTASAQNYQTQSTGASVTNEGTAIKNFALQPFPGTITGTVTSATTTDPLVGAVVVAYQGRTVYGYSLTDSNGNYTISGLAAGTYEVVAEATDYQIGHTSAIVTDGGTTIVDFALLDSPGALTGIVTDRCTGAGVGGVLVVVLDGTTPLSFGYTDSAGQYFIQNLPPGNFTVEIAKLHYVITSSPVTISAGSVTTLNFTFTPKPLPPATLTGSAFDNVFLTQKQRVQCINWTASPSGCVTSYLVYKNGVLVQTTPVGGRYNYCNINQSGKTSVTYSVRAMNQYGELSEPATITLK